MDLKPDQGRMSHLTYCKLLVIFWYKLFAIHTTADDKVLLLGVSNQNFLGSIIHPVSHCIFIFSFIVTSTSKPCVNPLETLISKVKFQFVVILHYL